MADAAANTDAMISPTGVAIDEPGVRAVEQDARRRQRVQAEEPGARRGTRARSSTSRASRYRPAATFVTYASATLTARGQQHEPEVARVVLPLHVELGADEQQRQPEEWQHDGEGDRPRHVTRPFLPPCWSLCWPWWQDTTGSKATAGPASSGRDRPRPTHARPQPGTARAPAAARALDAIDPGRRRAGRGAADAVRAVRLCRAVDASCRVRTGGSDPGARGPRGHPGRPSCG